MKRKQWFPGLWSIALSLGLVLSSFGCMVSGFDLQVSLFPVVCSCLGAAIATAFLQPLKKLKWLWSLWAILVLGFGFFGDLLPSSAELIRQLLTPEEAFFTPCTLALCFVSTGICILVSWCILAGKPIYPALSILLPPLLCLPQEYTTPDALWLYSFLGLFTLLLLTQGLRRRIPDQGNKLTAICLIPVLCISFVLYVAFPREGYQMDRLSLSLMHRVRDLFVQLPDPVPTGDPLKVAGGAVSLSGLGNRKETKKKILTVTSDVGGAMYLRSCSYDTYYNNHWTNLSVPDSLPWPDSSLLEPAGTVQIKTHGRFDMILTPYYPLDDTLSGVTRGINNYIGKRSYSYTFGQLPKSLPNGGFSADSNAYTQLPAQTKFWADGVLRELNLSELSTQQKADAIAHYVSGSAEYTLTPGKMPEGSPDFVRWFLETNRQGYCIHFASAGAVLLRAAGIPARYVTGFLFTAKAGEPTAVNGNQAHAWVEYWLPEVGWVVLELTPADAVSQQLAVPEASQPSAPQPEAVEENSSRLSAPPAWVFCLVFGIGLAVFLLQWPIRVLAKRHRCHNGSRNAQALAWWRQIQQITKRFGFSPDEVAQQIAEKAMFSQHSITESELEQIKTAFRATLTQSKTVPVYRRIWYRLVFALY